MPVLKASSSCRKGKKSARFALSRSSRKQEGETKEPLTAPTASGRRRTTSELQRILINNQKYKNDFSKSEKEVFKVAASRGVSESELIKEADIVPVSEHSGAAAFGHDRRQPRDTDSRILHYG